jgi:phosphoribosyl-AMP cyclohydrolase / phosphoribosyl-ATP pyrophosphohydrolase
MNINPNFSKYADGLVPAIVQDAHTHKVLMLGFMNEAALKTTQESGRVTFFSRSKQRLWTKGETSGHFLQLQSILLDCDADTLLVKAIPNGPACHTGADTCFNEVNTGFSLAHLEGVIRSRYENPDEKSYTSSLFTKGMNAVAQKVGEEAIELVIEAKDNDKEKFLGEAADLMFHYLVLLRAKGFDLQEVMDVLEKRHGKPPAENKTP